LFFFIKVLQLLCTEDLCAVLAAAVQVLQLPQQRPLVGVSATGAASAGRSDSRQNEVCA
jgi:hypothetical protein